MPHIFCWSTVLNDEAGRIFGAKLAQELAANRPPRDAFDDACKAVEGETESGWLDNGVPAIVQRFQLDRDPLDASLVHPVDPAVDVFYQGRLKAHTSAAQRARGEAYSGRAPRARRCRAAAAVGREEESVGRGRRPPAPAGHEAPGGVEVVLRDQKFADLRQRAMGRGELLAHVGR